ncbi:MAG: PepSY-associated TM helix domain-containing protein [Gemmatimonas sp.]
MQSPSATPTRLHPPAAASRQPGRPGGRQRASRLAFYGHLWIGVIFTIALVVIAITGILLNHKRALGLMPDVPHEPTAPFSSSLSLDSLAVIALRAANTTGDALPSRSSDPTRARVDRMDVRPRNGYVKVRLRDAASTEVTLDVVTGRVLHVGRRGDVFLEKLHSGETFGGPWVLLSDAAAVALVITLLTGYWLWLAPRLRRKREQSADQGGA